MNVVNKRSSVELAEVDEVERIDEVQLWWRTRRTARSPRLLEGCTQGTKVAGEVVFLAKSEEKERGLDGVRDVR
jgi:hypothetical protein